MLLILPDQQRLIKENLLALLISNPMLFKVLIGVAFIPLEPDTIPKFLKKTHRKCI